MIKVYHNSNFVEDGWTKELTGTLTYVANVNTDDLEVAFECTNHIGRNWQEHESVEMVDEGQHRSSSMGDIFETEDGKRYIVDFFGFKAL
jgi:hypothetical protein